MIMRQECGIADDLPAVETIVQSVDDDPWLSLVRDAADLVEEELPELVEIIDGIIAERSKLVIGSGSKSYKTWLTIHMGICIAHGIEFLGRGTARRRVLYVNLELKEQTFTRRVQTLAKALSLTIDRTWFQHLPLRGQLKGQSVMTIIDRIIRLAKHLEARVVVIDPLYKLNIEGEENNSRDQTRLLNEIDRITTEANCTVIFNDHFGKGNQSEKDPLDAIRGSSAKGGDVDAAMILRRHEVSECYSVDLIHRELPPVAPFVIGWNFPVMELRSELNAGDMKKPKGGVAPKYDGLKLLAAIHDTSRERPVSFNAWATKAGVPRQTLATTYATSFRSKGWIATAGEGNTARQYITKDGLAALNNGKGCRE